MIDLSKNVYGFDENANKKTLAKLETTTNQGFEIKLSGFPNVLYLDYMDCTLKIIQLMQKKFQSNKHKAKRMENLIAECEKKACDHHLLPKLRMETIKFQKMDEYCKKLREIVRLNILEDMEDVIIDATKIGFTDLKEYTDAKEWYDVEEKRLYQLKETALAQNKNFDIIIDQENQTKREQYEKGFDNRKTFRSEFMTLQEQKENNNDDESAESDLEILDIELELARDAHKNKVFENQKKGNKSADKTSKDNYDDDDDDDVDVDGFDESMVSFKDEPFIPLWTDDLAQKLKKHESGPPVSSYPHLRDWSNFRKMNVLTSKKDWLQYSKHKIPRTLSLISTERCGDKQLSIQLKKLALTCYNENLRKIIGDSKLKKSETRIMYAIDYIEAMSKHDFLKDESFLQLIKLTTNNTNPETCIYAWRMFYIVSMSFQPSGSLTQVLKTYLAKHAKSYGICGFNNIQDLATLCWKYCDPDLRIKSRPVKHLYVQRKRDDDGDDDDDEAPEPTLQEEPKRGAYGVDRYFHQWHHGYDEILTYQSQYVLTEIRKLFVSPRNIASKQIFVYSFDEKEDGIPITIPYLSTMSHIDVAQKICKLMGLLEPERYGLIIEIRNAYQDLTMLTLQEHANQWIVTKTPISLIVDELKSISEDSNTFYNLKWRFVFVKWCFSPMDRQLELESDIYVDFLYLQAFADVMIGKKIQLSDEKIALLATLEMIKSQRGNIVGPSDLDPTSLDELIPKYAKRNRKPQEWMSLCVDSVKNLLKHGLENFKTSMHYERQYLKVVQTSNLYGMTYFLVQIPIPARFKKHAYLLLGINWKHIMILTVDYKVVKQMSLRHLKSIKQDQSKPHSTTIFIHKDASKSKVETAYHVLSYGLDAKMMVEQLYQLRRLKTKATKSMRSVQNEAANFKQDKS